MDVIGMGAIMIGGGIIFTILVIAAGVFLGNLLSGKSSGNSANINKAESNSKKPTNIHEQIDNLEHIPTGLLADCIYYLPENGVPTHPTELATLELAGIDSKKFMLKCTVDKLYLEHIKEIFKEVEDRWKNKYRAKAFAEDYDERINIERNDLLELLNEDNELAKKFIRFLILVRFLFDREYLIPAKEFVKLWEKKDGTYMHMVNL
jgi:hypothetical protein